MVVVVVAVHMEVGPQAIHHPSPVINSVAVAAPQDHHAYSPPTPALALYPSPVWVSMTVVIHGMCVKAVVLLVGSLADAPDAIAFHMPSGQPGTLLIVPLCSVRNGQWPPNPPAASNRYPFTSNNGN